MRGMHGDGSFLTDFMNFYQQVDKFLILLRPSRKKMYEYWCDETFHTATQVEMGKIVY